jgi:predicted NUDIX family NTP pyrophosphohydrolase
MMNKPILIRMSKLTKRSAGLLMYRRRESEVEVFLVHPGGPFWEKKDAGAWTLPKGEYAEDENPLEAAKREFQEETGFPVGDGFIELGQIRQASGKLVSAWAFEGDCDPSKLVSNHCQVEWPPRSGRRIDIPEVDRGEWFSIPAARERILKSQEPLLDALLRKLTAGG